MFDDLVKSEDATFEDPQNIMKKWYFMVVTRMQKSDKNATATRWTVADRWLFLATSSSPLHSVMVGIRWAFLNGWNEPVGGDCLQ